jgi:hypothetical protein
MRDFAPTVPRRGAAPFAGSARWAKHSLPPLRLTVVESPRDEKPHDVGTTPSWAGLLPSKALRVVVDTLNERARHALAENGRDPVVVRGFIGVRLG